MQEKIDEVKRLFDKGIIDRETFTRLKLELIDELLKDMKVQRQRPDIGC
jgi:uncharacterized protein YqgQ